MNGMRKSSDSHYKTSKSIEPHDFIINQLVSLYLIKYPVCTAPCMMCSRKYVFLRKRKTDSIIVCIIIITYNVLIYSVYSTRTALKYSALQCSFKIYLRVILNRNKIV